MTTPTEYVFAGRTLRQPDPTKCRWVYEDTDVKITMTRGIWSMMKDPKPRYEACITFERGHTHISVGLKHTAEETLLELHRKLKEHVQLVQNYTCDPFDGIKYD